MTMQTITTSLVIQFTDPNAGNNGSSLSAEIDSRTDGFNKGVTTFIYGDNPAFLVYKTNDVSTTMQTTDGSVGSLGSVSISVKDYLVFANVNETSLSKPPAGTPQFTFLGSGAAALKVIGTRVIAPSPIIAIVKAEYTTTAQAYRLYSGHQEQVMIFILGTATS